MPLLEVRDARVRFAHLALWCALAAAARGADDACAARYAFAAAPAADAAPGTTRGRAGPGMRYALLAPDNRVFGAPLPGWAGVSAAAVVTPAMGAHFAMYMVRAEGGAAAEGGTRFPGAVEGLERFLFVLTGEVTVEGVRGGGVLRAGGGVYVAPGDGGVGMVVGGGGAVFVLIDTVYRLRPGAGLPESFVVEEEDVPVEVPEGEDFRLRRLVDPKDARYDFNVHLMDFHPGEYLAVKEAHYNQHGLLMLRGEGIYLLDGDYMPVQAGDVVWMAPFCVQWFAALGKEEARYFLYKDTTVDPLLHGRVV